MENGTQRDLGKLEGMLEALILKVGEQAGVVTELTKCVNALCSTVDAHIVRHMERENIESTNRGITRWRIQMYVAGVAILVSVVTVAIQRLWQ